MIYEIFDFSRRAFKNLRTGRDDEALTYPGGPVVKLRRVMPFPRIGGLEFDVLE
jgi:hypothetical protein